MNESINLLCFLIESNNEHRNAYQWPYRGELYTKEIHRGKRTVVCSHPVPSLELHMYRTLISHHDQEN